MVEKCWRRVLYRSVGEERWQHWCKKMSGIQVLLFDFSCIQLLLDSAACGDTATAPVSWRYYTCVYCILFRYSLHCSSLQSSRKFHVSNCLLSFRDIRRLVLKFGNLRKGN